MLKDLDPLVPVRAMRPNDNRWRFIVGLESYPRAAIEVSRDCPGKYADIILECINHGWIKPIAYLKESEYAWEILKSTPAEYNEDR